MDDAGRRHWLDILIGGLIGILITALASLLMVGHKLDTLDTSQSVRFEVMNTRLEVLSTRVSRVENVLNDITEVKPRTRGATP